VSFACIRFVELGFLLNCQTEQLEKKICVRYVNAVKTLEHYVFYQEQIKKIKFDKIKKLNTNKGRFLILKEQFNTKSERVDKFETK